MKNTLTSPDKTNDELWSFNPPKILRKMNFMRTIQMLLLSAFVILVGCAPKVIKMDASARESLNVPGQIHVLHYKPASFEMPPHPAGMMFGAIGGAISAMVAHSEGENILENFGIQDPILIIKERFSLETLQKFANMKISQIPEPLENDEIETLKENFTKGNILDFQTLRWGIVQPNEGFMKPRAFRRSSKAKYVARARLINANTTQVLWQGICDVESNSSFTTSDFENFGQEKGNFLEGTFNILASRCLNTLKKQFSDSS